MDSPRASAPEELCHWERLAEEFAENGWYHSIELPDGRVIEGLQSLEQQKRRLEKFPIPEDLTGKRVLDIGTWDGWFAFEMERRGAEVMAIDCVEQPAFHLAYDLLGSKVDYRVMDVADLSVERAGRFDIVLFFGVLYHLKHPLLALEKVCEITKDLALVESFVTGGELLAEGEQQRPSMEFYETGELCGRLDNWVGPNTRCLLAFCRTAGFARVELVETLSQRAHVVCREIVPNLVEGGRAAVLKPGSLRESSKPFTTKENRREETISHSGFREATASQPQRPHPPAQPKLPTHAALG